LLSRSGIELVVVGVTRIVFGHGGQNVAVEGSFVIVHVLAVLVEYEMGVTGLPLMRKY
jgi:hypothetical protein